MRRRLWSDEEVRDILVAVGQASCGAIALMGSINSQHNATVYACAIKTTLSSLASAFGIEGVDNHRPNIRAGR